MMQPRKVLTAAQMAAVDKRTVELGIPGPILMENAGSRVVEYIAEKFFPLSGHLIVVICGKGNNGGDGLVVARQLFTRFRCQSLAVVLAAAPEEMRGDAGLNLAMLQAAGCGFSRAIEPSMRAATLVIDALLGTGVAGPAKGRVLELIQEINTGFPAAEVVSIDMPSGLPSDTGKISGEYVRAAHTVTFTAAKVSQVLPPACYAMGHLRVCAIGSPPALYQDDPALWLSVTSPDAFADLFARRDRDANKGSYGHVLVVAGSRGKTGAAAMCGMAGLRMGAGLVTVACGASALSVIAAHAAELMTEGLPETEGGSIDEGALAQIINLAERKNVIAIGPGIGTSEGTVQLVRRLFEHCDQPMVVDADALNALAASEWAVPAGRLRILTPHPGEMARLTRLSISDVQADRVNVARRFARERGVCLVLKGDRTVTAFPDGRVWINPTGSPAMATGGTGDVLTGMIAGCLAQFPGDSDRAVAAAVYLHGAAGQIGAREIGEQSLVATDLLKFLPAAIFEIHDAL